MRLIKDNVERVAGSEAQTEKLMAKGFEKMGGAAAEPVEKAAALSGKNLTELKALAKEKGIEGYSSLSRQELERVLKDVV